jgi:AcrR family transcriptional regulator
MAEMTGLRERRKTHTRREIVEAALDLFEKNGFDATTVDDVAAAADVSPRTVFRHFATKEDIVFFGQSAETERLAALLAAAPKAGDPVDTLVAVTRALLLTPGATPEQLVRGRRLVERVPSLRAFKGTLMRQIEDLIAAALAPPRASRAERQDVRLLAAVHVAALDVVMTSWMEAGAKGTPTAELDTIEQLLRRAFPPRPSARKVEKAKRRTA